MSNPDAPVKGWETCPHCGARMQRVPIVYGLPGWELARAEQRGELVLGGCVIRGNDPQWACPECREALDVAPARRGPDRERLQ